MSLTQRAWSLTGSALSPRTLVLRRSNSGLRRAMYPSSVVQTGVKSLGCENNIAHLLPIHSWKLILPSVVSAVKSGAVAPKRSGITSSYISKEKLLSLCPALDYTTFLAARQFVNWFIRFVSSTGPLWVADI